MGIASLSDLHKLSRIGGKTIVIYLATTLVALVIGLSMVNLLTPGESVPDTLRERLAQTYQGDVAVMSFNPHSVAAMKDLAPTCPRGLVTEAFPRAKWAASKATLKRLREIPDYQRTDSVFISHQARDLNRPRVAELKQGGASIICWTIRSAKEERAARRVADNVTFEGYLA